MQSKNGFRGKDTTIGRVWETMKRFPDSRNNDAYLIWLILKNYGGLKLPFLEFQRFSELHFETIRRARQKIQRKGYYLPTDPKVLLQRKKEWMTRDRKRGSPIELECSKNVRLSEETIVLKGCIGALPREALAYTHYILYHIATTSVFPIRFSYR